ncbi:hypothetical protein [Ideonella sp.]|uniref:hypothetical protein n=1 Tax=Ideonella sp. TaxID=1929293 RepID=UPI003BB6D991
MQVTSSNVIDFEFDWGRDGFDCPTCNGGAGNSRLAYTDLVKNLWVAQVDFQTGGFLPANGKGELVDTLTALATDFGNGPEWMFSSLGSQLVYTKYLPDQTPSPETAGLGLATRGADGLWIPSLMEGGLKRQSPLGTQDVDDPQPRLHYQDIAKLKTFWRKADRPKSEAKVPVSGFNGGGRRWVPGTRKIIITGNGTEGTLGDGFRQVYVYDTDTDALEQVTNEAANHVGAMMWSAPEFGGELVFFSVRDGRQLVVHRKQADASGSLKWGPVLTVSMPEATPYVWSPEYFVHNGKSYIFFQMNTTTDSSDLSKPNLLAMVGILPENSGLTLLTPTNAPARVRMDPEYFITAKGPYIYYNRYKPATDTKPSIPEGVYRVDTRLGAPVTPLIPASMR